MPWGLVVAAVCSWLVYRRARDADRSPFGWVLILWVSVTAGAGVGMVVGSMLRAAGSAEVAIPICGLCGMLVAMLMVLRAASQPVPVAEQGGADGADRPEAAPQPVDGGPRDGHCPYCRAPLPDVADVFCPECREPLS